jgi:hypothetical protein
MYRTVSRSVERCDAVVGTPRGRLASVARRPAVIVGMALALGLVAFFMRYVGRATTFDLFVDEFVYEGLGRSVRSGGWPHFGHHLFYLHPPGFFYLEGLWENLTLPRDTDPIARIVAARGLNSVLAGISTGLLVRIVGRRSLLWGLFAGVLFAFDPFALRQNGRALLETATMTWALLGLAVLLPMLGQPQARHARLRAIVGGLALGCSILTKDIAVMVTLMPLLCAAILWRRQRPRWLPDAIIASVVPYGVYVLGITMTGHTDPWLQTKFSGILRMSGTQVTTGFSVPGAPSLWEQVKSQVFTFGPSYTLLALGGLGALGLLFRRNDTSGQLLALTFFGGALTVAYSLAFGTIEEQVLYFALVPAVPTCCSWGATLKGRRVFRRAPIRPAPILASILGVLLVGSFLNYLQWHRHTDDGYSQVRNYLLAHAEPGAAVIVVNGSSEFALDDVFRVGPFTTDGERLRYGARYLMVPWKEVRQGYTYVSLRTVGQLIKGLKPVFSFTGRTYGSVDLYKLPPIRTKDGQRVLSLHLSTGEARPTELVRIGGTYLGASRGARLVVQRMSRGKWTDYPSKRVAMTTTVSRTGKYSAYINLTRRGVTSLRVVDRRAGRVSDAVRLVIQ